MKLTRTFTHRAWFGVCPIYMGNIDSQAPHVHPRHCSLVPLMIVSELGYAVYFTLRCAIAPDFEPQWGMTITGELETPISIEGEA